MSRLLCLTLAASLSLAGLNLAYSQDTAPANSTDSSSTPNVAKLQAENTKLKKEVSDAAQTIGQLQTQLTQNQSKLSDTLNQLGQTQTQLTQSQAQLTQTQAQLTQTQAQLAKAPTAAAAEPAAPTAPAGPLKALPLDSTNTVANPAAPGSPAAADATAAGGKTYTVVKGDSLWKIAHKMYPGDTKNGVDKLQEANKDAIGGKPLKIGQVLIVPQ